MPLHVVIVEQHTNCNLPASDIGLVLLRLTDVEYEVL
jgi:hypothetical protein